MELKGRKGFTATVDAMFFIVLITMAFSLMFSMTGTDEKHDIQDASEILPILLEADVEVELDPDRGPVSVKLCDALVYEMYRDCKAGRAAEQILDSHFMREGAYALTVSHNGMTYTVGSGAGIPVSSCTQNVTGEYFTASYVLTVY